MSNCQMQTTAYHEYLAKVGGFAACGAHLGVFVAHKEHISQCPPGWVFVPLETATGESVKEAIEVAKAGRENWPTKSTHQIVANQ